MLLARSTSHAGVSLLAAAPLAVSSRAPAATSCLPKRSSPASLERCKGQGRVSGTDASLGLSLTMTHLFQLGKESPGEFSPRPKYRAGLPDSSATLPRRKAIEVAGNVPGERWGQGKPHACGCAAGAGLGLRTASGPEPGPLMQAMQPPPSFGLLLQPEVTQGPALSAVSSPVLCHTEVQELNEFLKLVLVSAGFCCLFVFNFPSRQGGGSLAGFSSRLMSHQFSHITEAIKLSNKLQWPLSSAACGGQRDSPAQAAPITFIATSSSCLVTEGIGEGSAMVHIMCISKLFGVPAAAVFQLSLSLGLLTLGLLPAMQP